MNNIQDVLKLALLVLFSRSWDTVLYLQRTTSRMWDWETT